MITKNHEAQIILSNSYKTHGVVGVLNIPGNNGNNGPIECKLYLIINVAKLIKDEITELRKSANRS